MIITSLNIYFCGITTTGLCEKHANLETKMKCYYIKSDRTPAWKGLRSAIGHLKYKEVNK